MPEHLIRDLRFATRVFLRSPRFTVPAVLALALGIGATSAIFSVVRGVLLQPLPYQNPDRIVSIWEANLQRNRPRNVIAAANYAAWQERSRSFEHIGMTGPARLNIMLDNQPYEVVGVFASSEVFRALGAQPLHLACQLTRRHAHDGICHAIGFPLVRVSRLAHAEFCLDQPLDALIAEALSQRVGARELRPTGFARDDRGSQRAALTLSRLMFGFVNHQLLQPVDPESGRHGKLLVAVAHIDYP